MPKRENRMQPCIHVSPRVLTGNAFTWVYFTSALQININCTGIWGGHSSSYCWGGCLHCNGNGCCYKPLSLHARGTGNSPFILSEQAPQSETQTDTYLAIIYTGAFLPSTPSVTKRAHVCKGEGGADDMCRHMGTHTQQ